MKAYEDVYYKMRFYTSGHFEGFLEIPAKSKFTRTVLRLTLKTMGLPAEALNRFAGKAKFAPATLQALEENEEHLIRILAERYGPMGIKIVHVEPTDGYVERRRDGIVIHIDVKGIWAR